MKHRFALLTLGLALQVVTPTHPSDAAASETASRDASARHIDDLVPVLAERTRPQEKLRGVVTAVDERNDRISLRLASNARGDFKVQDGLVFNAVRDGDLVEITVESIYGAKTIISLEKE